MSIINEKVPITADGLMSVREAAEFLQVCVATVYNLCERGDLPYCKIASARRIPRRALIELAERNLIGA
jgi:excisionase family DNA binding protein